jgi:hypothetical protein
MSPACRCCLPAQGPTAGPQAACVLHRSAHCNKPLPSSRFAGTTLTRCSQAASSTVA